MADDFETLTGRVAAAVTTTGLRIPDEGLPDNINPPCALLTPTNGSGLNLAETDTTETFELLVVVQQGGSRRAAHKNLLPYLARTGGQSVRLALQTGLAGDLLTVSSRQVGLFEVDGQMFWGARFEMEVISQ